MAYADGNDLIARYDSRTLGDLVSDTGTRVVAGLATNAVLLQALDDASGLVESACFVGNRYLSTDLTGLPTNSNALLERITCDLAFALLRQRRGYDIEQYLGVKESYELLNRLRLGERVFDVAEVKDKGNPTDDAIRKQTLIQQNLLRDNTRYFATRRWTAFQ